MKNTLFVIILTFCFLSCNNSALTLKKIEGKQLKTDSLITPKVAVKEFIAPFSKHLNDELDTPLCFTTKSLTKSDGELESSLGNLMADIAFNQTKSIVEKRHQKTIDFVLLNHGGIRAPIAKGTITARNAFEVMPFENELVVVALSAEDVSQLLSYLAKEHKPHPIANMKLEIEAPDDDETSYDIEEVTINNQP